MITLGGATFALITARITLTTARIALTTARIALATADSALTTADSALVTATSALATVKILAAGGLALFLFDLRDLVKKEKAERLKPSAF